jgi:3-methylcrotonyl-CoA carboxylase alpha subunit
MRHTFLFRPLPDAEAEEIRLEKSAEGWTLTRDGGSQRVDVARLPDGRWSLVMEDGRQICGSAVGGHEGEVAVVRAGERRLLSFADPLHDRIAHAGGSDSDSADEEVRAMMPGRVVEVRVSPGERVEPGALLLVLEAMKMQNEIRCRAAGRVADVSVATGDAVETGARLLRIESATAKPV